jgi:hypothetical protein
MTNQQQPTPGLDVRDGVVHLEQQPPRSPYPIVQDVVELQEEHSPDLTRPLGWGRDVARRLRDGGLTELYIEDRAGGIELPEFPALNVGELPDTDRGWNTWAAISRRVSRVTHPDQPTAGTPRPHADPAKRNRRRAAAKSRKANRR